MTESFIARARAVRDGARPLHIPVADRLGFMTPTPSDPFEGPREINYSPFAQRMTLPHFSNEQELRDWVLTEVADHFHVDEEVWGTHCSGRRLRMDAVLKPKDASGWADGPDIAVGVEFKLPKGALTNNKWIAQCLDYGHTDWDNYGRLAIFACPGLRMNWSDDADRAVGHLLGQMRIGELVKLHRDGWSLVMHTHHVQWSQARGVDQARWTLLRPKIGSR